MKMYVIENGYVADSPIFCVVVARDESHALELVNEKLNGNKRYIECICEDISKGFSSEMFGE